MAVELMVSSGQNYTWNGDHNNTWNKTVGNTTPEFKFWQVPQVIFLSCLLAAIIIGNTCVLAAISLSDNGRKTRMNFFIMHLAIADLCVGLFLVSLDIGEKLSIEWLAGNVLCKILMFTKAFVSYASTYVLVSLSIDRFDAIARPMNFSGRKFRARVLIGTAWILAGIFSLPSLVLFKERTEHVTGHNFTMCVMNLPGPWHWQLYISLIALATFIIPALIITVCYTIIISIVWRKSNITTDSDDVISGGQDDKGQVTLEARDIHYKRGISTNLIQQAKIRTIKMTFIIVIVFVICWCPYFLFNLLYVFNVFSDTESLRATNVLMQSMAPLNSAFNPIIYGVFSTRICANLRRIRIIDSLARLVCPCPLKRNKPAARMMSRGSWNDPTMMTEGSTKSTQRTSACGIKRTLSEESPVLSSKIPMNHCGKKVLFRGNLNNGCYSDKSNKPRRFRRPSGLPLVKRVLSEEDNNLLKALSVKRHQKIEESKI